MNIRRVIPFGDMSQSASTLTPQFSNLQALLEPFPFFSDVQGPASFHRMGQPFTSNSSMMPLTDVSSYQSNSIPVLLSHYHPVEYNPYDTPSLNTSLYPLSASTYPSLPLNDLYPWSYL
ncbi:uncharacterized protein MELLADRAFT_73151 [Melampsora larici-populina 98AG31]|uniref:Uncharacterized protein n=1 Tax=Melampsora larici-populina (strain 98AG31 / pathotype 3-4-7) TaxID=747676 RepID=F4S427_MELLP|nr:uncharacterized protein MELLADRAFT_73151 [Melampsora larici-populina 98AG31]EGG00635.1 hypothetical protein MELLADRAFT_73151 [Melampsora larici-populina 98AG31]